jgi:polyphosphate kinase
MKGTSETIDVVSIVDRFLEHARIFYFRNGGDEEVYLSSADWMPRNMDRRIELLFPVDLPEGREKVLASLDAMFLDTVKARWLQSDGSYKRKRAGKGEEPFRSQIHLYREAQKVRERARAASGLTLEPMTAPEVKAAGS